MPPPPPPGSPAIASQSIPFNDQRLALGSPSSRIAIDLASLERAASRQPVVFVVCTATSLLSVVITGGYIMATESQEDKLARQARLSKALSAAYISHQITQLEDKVQGGEAGKRSGSPSTNKRGGRGGQRGNHRDGRRGGEGGGRGRDRERGRGGQARGGTDRDRCREQQPRRVVLDTSALLFALPRVRNLIKNQAEVVVPLEALNTLDLLKKSMHSLSVKARQATRFIEDAQERTRDQARQEGNLDDFEPGEFRQGLWIQDELETDNNLGWEPLAEIRADQDDGVGAGDEAHDPQGEEAMPNFVASTLQCASYFRHVWEFPEEAPILVICPETQNATEDGEKEEEASHIVRFGDRAQGHAMKQWAEIMGIGCLDFTAAVGVQGRDHKGGNGQGRENGSRTDGKGNVKHDGTAVNGSGHGSQLDRPATSIPASPGQSVQPIRLLRPEVVAIRPQSPAPPASPQKQPSSPARVGGLTKEALERSQAILEAQEMEDAARRREASEMHRVQNEQRRGLERSTPGLIVRPAAAGGAPISLLTRPRAQDARGSPGGHGRAPAKMDKDGIKLLRPDPNQPVAVLPRQPSRGSAKVNGKSGNPPQGKPVAQVKERAPPFVLLQRPK